MRRTQRKNPSQFIGLDSLVDIVSNNVGILIILAAFMALYAMLNPIRQEQAEGPKVENRPPEKLLIPWSHPTNKNHLLFVLHGNRVQHLDMKKFFVDLAQRAPSANPEPLNFKGEGVDIRFFPVTNQIFCMEYAPHKGAGENWLEAEQAGSRWRTLLGRYTPENYVLFFWVTPDSFELFREIRQNLWEAQYEVGWKPAEPGKPLEVCNGFEGATSFSPQ